MGRSTRCTIPLGRRSSSGAWPTLGWNLGVASRRWDPDRRQLPVHGLWDGGHGRQCLGVVFRIDINRPSRPNARGGHLQPRMGSGRTRRFVATRHRHGSGVAPDRGTTSITSPMISDFGAWWITTRRLSVGRSRSRGAAGVSPRRRGPGESSRMPRLEAEDRRYLERRAITLFVIEGRTEEALDSGRPTGSVSEPRRSGGGGSLHPVRNRAAQPGDRERYRRSRELDWPPTPRWPRSNPRLADRFAVLPTTTRGRAPPGGVRIMNAEVIAIPRWRRPSSVLSVAPDDAIFAAAVSSTDPQDRNHPGLARRRQGDGLDRAAPAPHGGEPAAISARAATNTPSHEVTLDGFWIDRTEVTNDEYRSCVRAGACTPPQRTEVFDSPNLGKSPGSLGRLVPGQGVRRVGRESGFPPRPSGSSPRGAARRPRSRGARVGFRGTPTPWVSTGSDIWVEHGSGGELRAQPMGDLRSHRERRRVDRGCLQRDLRRRAEGRQRLVSGNRSSQASAGGWFAAAAMTIHRRDSGCPGAAADEPTARSVGRFQLRGG